MKKEKNGRRLLAVLLALIMAAGMLPMSALAAMDMLDSPGVEQLESSGPGTLDDPYLIGSAAELALMAATVNGGADRDKHYKLTDNIDLSDYDQWTHIGLTATNSFTGVFDGSGHTISGMTIEAASGSFRGLFGYIGSGGLVKDFIRILLQYWNRAGGV